VLAERVEGGWRVRIIDWGLAQALENEHATTARESPLTRTNGGSPRAGLRWEADAQLHAAAHAEFASASNSGSISGSSTEFPLSPHEQPRGRDRNSRVHESRTSGWKFRTWRRSK
jgi:hypothetical protein